MSKLDTVHWEHFFAREQVQSTLPTGMDDAYHQDLFRCWDVQSVQYFSYRNMSNRTGDPKRYCSGTGPTVRCPMAPYCSKEKSRLYHTKLLEERVAESIRKAAEKSSSIVFPGKDPGRGKGWLWLGQNRKAKQKDWWIDMTDHQSDPVAAFGRLTTWDNHLSTKTISPTSRTIIDRLFSKLSRMKWHIHFPRVWEKTVSCRDCLVSVGPKSPAMSNDRNLNPQQQSCRKCD